MNNEELIIKPLYYCPKCNKIMQVIFYEREDEPMDVVAATCQNGHQCVLRIKKNAPEKTIVEQMQYVVESKGGHVIYED